MTTIIQQIKTQLSSIFPDVEVNNNPLSQFTLNTVYIENISIASYSQSTVELSFQLTVFPKNYERAVGFLFSSVQQAQKHGVLTHTFIERAENEVYKKNSGLCRTLALKVVSPINTAPFATHSIQKVLINQEMEVTL